MPQRLEDLQGHRLLYFGSARRAQWSFLDGDSKTQTIEFQPFLNSNNGMFLLDSVKAGLGIARLPSFVVRDEENKGNLVPLLSDLAVPQWNIYLVHTENRRLNRRMRVFAEDMTKACLSMS